jgi:Ser/Thr protein kinase RdoA (MazF antagonist)
MSEYEEMTQDEQILLLEEFARDVLPQYKVEAKRFECVNHAFNSTFKITTLDDQLLAMRINTNSKKWPRQVEAEVQWLKALAQAGIISAPVPIANLQGELFSNHYFYYLGTNLNVVLYSWIEGEVIEGEPTSEQLFALGQQMAYLHESGETWNPTGEGALPRIDTPLMVKRDNLFVEPDARVNTDLYKLLMVLNERTLGLFESLNQRFKLQPIHADLHSGNIIWDKDQISIIDFDDCGIGLPLQDFAISLYYLRDNKSREEHLLAGYRSIRPIPEHEPWELELLIASRAMSLLNYLLETSTAEHVAYLPTYLAHTEKRLEHYFETGEFLLLK